jgi:peptidoglycan hydrolase CwlO-like protein
MAHSPQNRSEITIAFESFHTSLLTSLMLKYISSSTILSKSYLHIVKSDIMHAKALADLFRGIATDLKTQAEKATHELECSKSQISKKLDAIDLEIDKLNEQKLIEWSKSQEEIKEKEETARTKQDIYTHFALATNVSLL